MRATINPVARTIPATIKPQGVDDVEAPDGVATAIVVEVDSALDVVVGGTVVVGASVVGVVVGGTVVVGTSLVGVVVGAAVVVGVVVADAPVVGVVGDGSAMEGLLVEVDGDEVVVLGLFAGGFVDPEPPHALSVSATAPAATKANTWRCFDDHGASGMWDADRMGTASASSISSGHLILSVSRSRRAQQRRRRMTPRP